MPKPHPIQTTQPFRNACRIKSARPNDGSAIDEPTDNFLAYQCFELRRLRRMNQPQDPILDVE